MADGSEALADLLDERVRDYVRVWRELPGLVLSRHAARLLAGAGRLSHPTPHVYASLPSIMVVACIDRGLGGIAFRVVGPLCVADKAVLT